MSTSMEEETKKTITLRSYDNVKFQVEEAVMLESHTIKLMVEDGCADGEIPLSNVTGAILSKLIEYCKYHAEAKADDGTVKAWDAEFIKVDLDTLHDLMLAANYLEMPGLLDLTCQTVADMIKDKTPEQIRKLFNIPNDFTPEEEDRIRKENAWAFE